MKFYVVSTIWETFLTEFLGIAGFCKTFELFKFELF